MIRKEKGGIAWLEFELFQGCKELKSAVFLKAAGSLKLEDNLKKAMSCLGLAEWSKPPCNHGGDVVAIEDFTGFGHFDGFLTQKKGLGLVITHADCQAGVFYDPKTRAIAGVHSGWRGSVQNIFGNTIKEMHRRFGANPKDILVGISPSLGPDESEFVNHETEFPESFLRFQHKKNFFDLWALSESQLLESGIQPQNIQIARVPTMQNPQDFFSYRRGDGLARNATIVALAKNS